MKRALMAVVALIALTACHGGQATQLVTPAPVTSATEWAGTLAQANREVREGRFGVADKLLVDFSSRNATAPEAPEALYWRALYKLDPANSAPSAREAAALLDAYLASGNTVRRPEAAILRHVASTLESYASVAAASSTKTAEPSRAEDKAKDEELARLKDELAKANAELDRIKRRLAQPKP